MRHVLLVITVNGTVAIIPAAIIAALIWGYEKSQAQRPSYLKLFRNSFIFMFILFTAVLMISLATSNT